MPFVRPFDKIKPTRTRANRDEVYNSRGDETRQKSCSAAREGQRLNAKRVETRGGATIESWIRKTTYLSTGTP